MIISLILLIQLIKLNECLPGKIVKKDNSDEYMDYAHKRTKLDPDTLSFMNEYNRNVKKNRRGVYIDSFDKLPIHHRSLIEQQQQQQRQSNGINMRSIVHGFTITGMLLASIFFIVMMVMASKECLRTIETTTAII
ncbi:hypothetical protein DERP_009493 [Dermatophagoides pteronyssinus]|uniref:Uncharacterized protein n=1 Tax=Dermatophagoides pteronyssinus TaxID=6956 RepID=A0ABQ8IUA6_DERPT|nr:hypothetical protein DERP_009493 [Dermatophagoides pteronyssinus]